MAPYFKIIIGLSFIFSSLTHAEEHEDNIKDTIIVTATRAAQAEYDVVPSTIVITREDIENTQALDLAELLRFQAGLDIGRNGGPGQTTSVFIRGTESNHTLILIDGVEMNPGTIGGGAMQNISPEMIERIEIVKGARSSLYGSEAIGGVISITTRNSNKSSIDMQLGLGSFNSQKLSFSSNYKQDNNYIGLSLEKSDTDGFPTLLSATEDRGFDNLSAKLKAGTNILDTDIEFSHWQSDGNTEYFDFFGSPLDQDFTNAVTSLKFDKQLNKNLSSQLIIGKAKDDIEQNQANFLGQTDFVKTNRFTVDWFNQYQLTDHTKLFGGSYFAREKTSALSFGSEFSDPTEIKALFVGTDTKLGQTSLLANLRYSDHDTAGNQTSWNLEALYPLSSNTKIGFSAGSAFRAPDATDRFGFGGNPDLKTEESDNFAISFIANTEYGNFRLEAFNTDIDNLINYVITDINTFAGQNQNIDQAQIQGIELQHKIDFTRISFATTAIIQSPKDTNTDTLLLRRAQRSLSTDILYRFESGHNIGLQGLLTSQRNDFASNLAGYALLNLTGKYQINNRLSLFAKIENLLDTNYQTAAGFRQSERAAYLNLRLNY